MKILKIYGILLVALLITFAFTLSACQKEEATTGKQTEAQIKTEALAPQETLSKGIAAPERPSDADLMAFKVYHHAVYLETTAQQAGGTNKLFHTTELPTEGTDPVVTPALDHLYTKAVIDLTSGPVVVELPEVERDRYFSIQIMDQEHYTLYDEIQPAGKYAIVRKGKNMKVPEGATVIECRGDYPHLFVRVQVYTDADRVNIPPIQQKVKLTAVSSKTLTIENPVKFTLETHDVYPQNKKILTSAADFSENDYKRVSNYIGVVAPKFSVTGNTGMFGPIDSKEPHSNDPEYRAAAMVGHLGFPIHHAFYKPYFTNCNDEVLNGDKTEVFVFPYKPKGVELFWSVTRYSALTRNTIPGKNDLLNAYNTKPDANGNITVTFSVEDPKDGTYWMPVNAGEPYYFVVRYYKPDVDKLPPKPCK
ncbi:MAG: DUF1254 domain-containing protein [Planctomycetes bacterium]|nr:DUF1254 domain-containing protein [Planctomycetota bacterium]